LLQESTETLNARTESKNSTKERIDGDHGQGSPKIATHSPFDRHILRIYFSLLGLVGRHAVTCETHFGSGVRESAALRGGFVPLGCDLEGRKLIPNTKESELIRKILSLNSRIFNGF
jgi:hypothetical protein